MTGIVYPRSHKVGLSLNCINSSGITISKYGLLDSRNPPLDLCKCAFGWRQQRVETPCMATVPLSAARSRSAFPRLEELCGNFAGPGVHFRFVREHHKKIECVTMVTDGYLGTVMPAEIECMGLNQ